MMPINTIIQGDCLEVMKDWPDGCVDLVLTDPPYGINLNHKNQDRGRGNRAYDPGQKSRNWPAVIGDDKPFDPTPLLQFPNLIIWGANHFADKLPSSSFWLCWDRKVGKAAENDITDCELAWTRGRHYKTTRIFRHMWAGFQRDSQVGQRHLHPTEKPIALMQWCLGWFPKADLILDPFCGSGTTCVAAKMLGRNYIGIDISSEYVAIAKERLRAIDTGVPVKEARNGQRALFE